MKEAWLGVFVLLLHGLHVLRLSTGVTANTVEVVLNHTDRTGEVVLNHTDRTGEVVVNHTDRTGDVVLNHTDRTGEVVLNHTDRTGDVVLNHTDRTGDVLNSTGDQSVNGTEVFGDPNVNYTSPDSEVDSATIPPGAFDTTTTNVTPPGEAENITTPTTETPLTTATPLTTETPSPPLPAGGSRLVHVTDVTRLCPCNQQQDQCDVNCCCDPDCSAELPLFTVCSVQRVSGDSQLCSQEAAYYSMGTGADGFAEVQKSVHQELNTDLFCIHFTNNEAGLSHPSPTVPTPGNFDRLFRRFAEFTFGSEPQGGTLSNRDRSSPPGYQFGDVMGTLGENGNKGFLLLPAPSVTAHCSDMNPAAFLRDQSTRCSRSLVLERDCSTLPGLNMHTYAGVSLLSGKSEDAAVVTVEIAPVTYQSLEGAQSPLLLTDYLRLDPVLITQETQAALCANVVLQVGYVITHSEAGEVVNVSVALTLGAVTEDMLPLEQQFHITFLPQHAEVSVRFSGNPGYVLGLPLVAGSRTAEGIVRSSDPRGELTLLHGSSMEDCLSGSHQRVSVLFGVNVVSGCTLRLAEVANCFQVSEVLTGVLRGQNVPQYVASFGNSQPQIPMDWVPIKRDKITTDAQSCNIPLSLHLEVKWTNYGSLVNPQAHILSVKEVIRTNTSSLALLSGGSGVISITSSVSFVSVSAPALPGYRASPTIDAKLPYRFFLPFV